MDQPKKILVIEHDEVVVFLISHLLTGQSYIVHVSLDVGEAAALLEREHYDAILIEPRTPNGGVELIHSIASHSRELLSKVILVTSDANHPLADLPLHGVIRKPVEIANLIDTVRDCVKPRSERE